MISIERTLDDYEGYHYQEHMFYKQPLMDAKDWNKSVDVSVTFSYYVSTNGLYSFSVLILY
jgi:hypothetical protein